MSLLSSVKGFTLLEILVAALLASVVASATLLAFVAAARMARAQNNPAISEATGYAHQTIEAFRNKVAADQTFLEAKAGLGWQDDPLPRSGGSDSILTLGATRKYNVEKVDCDGDGTTGDCYAVTSRVCWNDSNCWK